MLWIRWIAVLLLLVVPVSAQEEIAPPVAVSYTLDATSPESGTVAVEMRVENNRDDEVTLGIPVWAPGSYRVVPYYLAVRDLAAEVGGKPVEVKATDHKSLWTLQTGRAKRFTVRYTLKPSEVPPLSQHLSKDRYDLQGPSAWLFVKDRLDGPHQVTFKLPANWRVGTGLQKMAESTYGARDYDTFIDCPTALGPFSLHSFQHDNVLYELVVHASGAFDAKKLAEVCRKIVAEQARMFGGAPFERYVFIFHFRDQQGGSGLEHLNSTHISFPMQAMSADPTYIASLVSHEFFHLWNVKRIRPKELGPFDYTRPVRSKALWLCEGVTSYYGDLSLARAGIWSRETYLGHLAQQIDTLQANPARLTQSVEEASRTVWDRPRGDRTPSIDYYNKGELLGWLIDLKIRAATGGKKSFDDVMRLLYRRCVTEPAKAGKGPIGVGFEEGGILRAVNDVSGEDFTEFFAQYVSGTEELPYAKLMEPAGLALGRQKSIPLTLQGLRVSVDPAPGSEAAKAGLKRNDRVVKVNGQDVTTRTDLAKVVEKAELGDTVEVQLSRRGEEELLKASLKVVEGAYRVKVLEPSTDAHKAFLKDWLAPSK